MKIGVMETGAENQSSQWVPSSELAVRLSRASVKKAWDVYSRFDWPEKLEPSSAWFMSPELISIYGTDAYNKLTEEQQKRLSFYEIVNFFSFTLQGERPLVQGLAHQMYARQGPENTEYIHHFLDEENKHMVMFGMFCHKYAGKVYPEKKIALAREYEPGEEDVVFFIKALAVEELGDYYNILMMRDERIHPLVKEINFVHHVDEARHIAFGRTLLRESFQKYSPKWSKETRDGLGIWVGNYLNSCWADFYNPTMYKDAGLQDAYNLRTRSMEYPICIEHRNRVSKGLVDFLTDVGILSENHPFA